MVRRAGPFRRPGRARRLSRQVCRARGHSDLRPGVRAVRKARNVHRDGGSLVGASPLSRAGRRGMFADVRPRRGQRSALACRSLELVHATLHSFAGDCARPQAGSSSPCRSQGEVGARRRRLPPARGRHVLTRWLATYHEPLECRVSGSEVGDGRRPASPSSSSPGALHRSPTRSARRLERCCGQQGTRGEASCAPRVPSVSNGSVPAPDRPPRRKLVLTGGSMGRRQNALLHR